MTGTESQRSEAFERVYQKERKFKLAEKREAEKQRKIENKRKYMIGEAILEHCPELKGIDLKSTAEEVIKSIKNSLK